MPAIKTFRAADLARNTGVVLDAASREPVAITKHQKPRFVIMSVEHYETLLSRSDQKAHTLDGMPNELVATMADALERDLSHADKPDA